MKEEKGLTGWLTPFTMLVSIDFRRFGQCSYFLNFNVKLCFVDFIDEQSVPASAYLRVQQFSQKNVGDSEERGK